MDESLINETNRKSRHPCWTPTARALWAAFALNTTFTCGQLVGALAANSIAMLGDTSTMFVDSVTYAAGLLGEYHKNQSGPRTAAAVELSAASFSVIALFGCLQRDSNAVLLGG
jgi:Co/Zn/Cd efflux system component